jgi:hypothetical protein
MTQQGRAWTDAEDAMIRRMHAEGSSRNSIARAVGCSQATLSKRAHTLGLAFDSSRVREGVETRSLDLRAKRMMLAELQMEQAVRLANAVSAPHKVTVMAAGEWRERELEQPSPRDQRDLALASSQLAASSMRLIEFDRGGAGTDAARSMVGALMTALTAHVAPDDDAEGGEGDDDGDDG